MRKRSKNLQIGFVPLLDCAPLVVAREQGFFRQQGLNVTLSREPSWSSIRDKLAYGLLDGAQTLAPMPLASTLGLGANPVPMLSGLALSRHGNAITCSSELHQRLQQHCDTPNDPLAMGQALKRLLPELERKPVFATVYPYSNHFYQLRRWLLNSGIDPEREVDCIAIPPPRMITALEQGQVDGYCVGEPWNTLAVLSGSGLILATGEQLDGNIPEKLFTVCNDWHQHNPEQHAQLIRALSHACRWIGELDDKQPLLELLALPPYLDQAIYPLLQAGYAHHWGRAPLNQQFILPANNRPLTEHGQWLVQQMVASGQLEDVESGLKAVEQVFRPALLEQALGV